MELSEATLELLQDEAYASLCRETLQEKLASLEREKTAIAETRPPFGLLARKEARDAFAQSMRTALDSEAALRERLARIDGIGDWLRPLIRNDLSTYLANVSPPYGALLQIAARLGDWEHALQALPELLVAFARDVRELQTAAAAAGASAKISTQELAMLRQVIERLDRHRHELAVIEQAVGALAAAAGTTEIRLAGLPDFPRVAWLGRLAVLPAAQVLAELTRVEAEVRAFLAEGRAAAEARLLAACDVCANLLENALEQYWSQLRDHARLHYVEAREVDDVLDMLTRRYIDADIKRRQDKLSANPFLVER